MAVYEFRVTRNCFWAVFSFKIRFLRSHLDEIRPKACRKFFFNYQAVASWNYFVTVPAKGTFSLLLRSICFLPNDTLQLKILYGYPEGKYCQYPCQRSLYYEAKKRRFDESLVLMLFEFLIVLDAGLWQVSLIRSICNLILFARCKRSGSWVCNKWMVLQDSFLFLPLCLSSYDWIKIISILVQVDLIED